MKKAFIIISAPFWFPALLIMFALAAMVQMPRSSGGYGEPLPRQRYS